MKKKTFLRFLHFFRIWNRKKNLRNFFFNKKLSKNLHYKIFLILEFDQILVMGIESENFILMLFCQYLTKFKNLKYFIIQIFTPSPNF